MKIQLHDNEYMEIYLFKEKSAYVKYGRIEKTKKGELNKVMVDRFHHDSMVRLLTHMGFCLKDEEKDLINYFRKNDYFIEIQKVDEKNTYYIRNVENDRVIHSSEYFMQMMTDHVLPPPDLTIKRELRI